MKYNPLLNVANLGTRWISRANAKQRSGRAGRVQEGECYRVFTREVENALMEEFPTPEILRIPLENVVMQTKFHCPNELVAQFLSEVPQPPTCDAIKRAVDVLKDIKILDQNERLTTLGNRIINFSTHPRLSVALVYSAFFSCLRSMLPLISHLSANRHPFQVLPDQKQLIREVKTKNSSEIMSDHIPLIPLTIEYLELWENNRFVDLRLFCEDNYLHRYSMNTSLDTIKLFASDLEQSQLICRNIWNCPKSVVNFNWHRTPLIMTALVPAFASNLVRFVRGEIRNQKIRDNTLSPIDVRTGAKVKFVSESVFHTNFNVSQQLESVSNSILTYFGSFYSEDARMLTICDASIISPFALLLFADNKFKFNFDDNIIKNIANDECIIQLHNNQYLQFRIKREDLELLSRWNKILNLFFDWFVSQRPFKDTETEENQQIIYELQDFLQYTNLLVEKNDIKLDI